MLNYSLSPSVISSLEVTNYFVTLEREDERTYTFSVAFSMLQSEIVKKNFSTLDVYFETPFSSPTPPAKTPEQEIEEIRKKNKKQISDSKAKENRIVSRSTVDLAGSIDPKVRTALQSGKKPSEINELMVERSALTVLPKNFVETRTNLSKKDIKNINLSLIVKEFIDPATVFSNLKSSDVGSIKDSLYSYYLHDAPYGLDKDREYYGVEKKVEIFERKKFLAMLTIEKSQIKKSTIYDVVFEVYAKKSTFPTIMKREKIDLSLCIKLSKLINEPPSLEIQNNYLVSHQKDKLASGISIIKKDIDDQGQVSRYSTFHKNVLSVNNSNGVIISVPKQGIEIYRCTAQNLSTLNNSAKFSSVITGDRFLEIDGTVLLIGFSSSDSKFMQNSLSITLMNQPITASQFKIVRRQRITEDAFGPEKTIVDYSRFSGNSTVVTDESAEHNRIYEYSVYYKMADGSIKKSVTQIYRNYSSLLASAINTQITNLSVTNNSGKVAVQFNIDTSLKEDDLDRIKYAFINANIYEEHRFDFSRVRDEFSKIINHYVVRLNRSTGVREEFTGGIVGTLTEIFRDDESSQKKFLVSPIDPNHDYCYEVYVSLHSPDTLLRSSIRTETVSFGNSVKTYTYSPYRWRQPSTLEDGTLPQEDERGNITLQEPILDAGIIGKAASILVNGKSQDFGVFGLKSQRIDRNKVRVSWSVDNINNFDHFVVIKELARARIILGSVFSNEIIDYLSEESGGSLIYYVVPVLNDYSVGSARRSATIMISPDSF